MTEKESRIKAIAIMKKSGSILGFSGTDGRRPTD